MATVVVPTEQQPEICRQILRFVKACDRPNRAIARCLAIDALQMVGHVVGAPALGDGQWLPPKRSEFRRRLKEAPELENLLYPFFQEEQGG